MKDVPVLITYFKIQLLSEQMFFDEKGLLLSSEISD